MSLKTIVSQSICTFGVKKHYSLRLSSPLLTYTNVKFRGVVYPGSCEERLRLLALLSVPRLRQEAKEVTSDQILTWYLALPN